MAKANHAGAKNVTQDKDSVRGFYGSYAQEYALHYLNPKTLFDLEKQRRLELVQHNFQKICPSSVLDLGCGPGYTTFNVEGDLCDATVVGMDFSPEMIGVASQNYAATVFFLQGDAESLPFEDGHFSAIFALGLLEKFKIPLRVLNECYRVLVPGGYLLFSYPNKASLIRTFRRWVGAFLGKDIELQSQDFLSIEEIRGVVHHIGFKITDITFLTYGNSFIFFPWSKTFNIIVEKFWGKNKFGRLPPMTVFFVMQKEQTGQM